MDKNFPINIGPAEAKKLIKCRSKTLDISEIEYLDEEVAEILSGFRRNLALNGLKELSLVAAAELVKHRGGKLSLNGLGKVSDDLAGVLLRHGDGNTELIAQGILIRTDSVSKLLRDHLNSLSLQGVLRMSDTAMETLLKYPGEVQCYSLERIKKERFDHEMKAIYGDLWSK